MLAADFEGLAGTGVFLVFDALGLGAEREVGARGETFPTGNVLKHILLITKDFSTFFHEKNVKNSINSSS